MEAAVGLSRNDLEKISKTVGYWAALAQRRYFAELRQTIKNHDTSLGAMAAPYAIEKLSALFQDFESLRLQSQRVREALELFDTVVVPNDYNENETPNETA